MTQEVIAAGLGSSSFSSFGLSLALIHGILLGAWSRLLLGSQGEERETRDEKRVT